MEKYYKQIRWGILGLLALGFLYAGVMKLLGKENATLLSWGFPIWSIYIIGAFQTFAALGLFHRSVVKMSLFIQTTIMMCALLTLAGKHLFFPDMILPLLYLIGLFGLMYLKAKRDPEEEGRWGLI